MIFLAFSFFKRKKFFEFYIAIQIQIQISDAKWDVSYHHFYMHAIDFIILHIIGSSDCSQESIPSLPKSNPYSILHKDGNQKCNNRQFFSRWIQR